jgi:biopolymer transport protein ExbB/TolQ
MGILTLILVTVVAVGIINGLPVLKGNCLSQEICYRKISYIKSVGLFALIFGILGQMIGLYSAFAAIEQMGGVSPAMLAGGLKVSSITTIYGLVIYVIALLIWFLFSLRLEKPEE